MQVRVQDDVSQALPFVHIKVNGYAVASTDLTGTANLDVSKLHSGDTITATFLGKIPDSTVFDTTLSQKGECILVLREDRLLLDEIVVVPDAKALFYKVARVLPPINYHGVMRADYRYSFFRTDHNRTYAAQGELSVVNKRINRKNRGWFFSFYREIAQVHSSGDTTVVRIAPDYLYTPYKLFNTDSHLDAGLYFSQTISLSILNRTLYSLATKEREEWKFYYGGKKDGMHVFTITYPETPGNPFHYQLQVFVDQDSGDIRHADLVGVAWTPYTDQDYVNEIRISTDIEEYINTNPKKKAILTTRNFTCNLLYRNGSRIELALENESIQAL